MPDIWSRTSPTEPCHVYWRQGPDAPTTIIWWTSGLDGYDDGEWGPRIPSAEEMAANTRDMLAVARFIVGFWPGLEEGLDWPDDADEPMGHSVFVAAQQLLDRIAPAPRAET